MGKFRTPRARALLERCARAVDKHGSKAVYYEREIQALRLQIERLDKKKRKKIPNPNKAFMTIAQILAKGGGSIEPSLGFESGVNGTESDLESKGSESDEEENEGAIHSPKHTRSGRIIKLPNRYTD
ncbi:hypothetical protein F4810DRAFT_667503 [Camillea tinctor]|nr:hypothetical protein F4810DRAFT_667503 [Camillea tinctor]